MKTAVKLFMLALLLAIVTILARSNPERLGQLEVQNLVRQLNEAAAIGVPHDFLMRAETRKRHLALLSSVESGVLLTHEETDAYRRLYQSTLQENQRFLGAFDFELTILSDHMKGRPNNVSGQGIPGIHDHHDLSAHKNFTAMLDALHKMESASNPASRIFYVNAIQKHLVDLISHIGVMPHTVSVQYEPASLPPGEAELSAQFDAMLKAYKRAQFSDVNGATYWQAIDEGMDHYTKLILAVQTRIWAQTSSLERRIAGRFLAPQTGAPPIALDRKMRPRPS